MGASSELALSFLQPLRSVPAIMSASIALGSSQEEGGYPLCIGLIGFFMRGVVCGGVISEIVLFREPSCTTSSFFG